MGLDNPSAIYYGVVGLVLAGEVPPSWALDNFDTMETLHISTSDKLKLRQILEGVNRMDDKTPTMAEQLRDGVIYRNGEVDVEATEALMRLASFVLETKEANLANTEQHLRTLTAKVRSINLLIGKESSK